MPEGKSELSILLLAAIERLDEASQVWGWQADQGYDGAEIQKAENEHVRALYSLKLAVADALLAEREATEAKMLALLKDPAAVRTACSVSPPHFASNTRQLPVRDEFNGEDANAFPAIGVLVIPSPRRRRKGGEWNNFSG